MSQKFYLNDLMADANVDDMQEIFEHTMKQYVQIRKESLLDIEKYIVLGDEFSNIKIGGKPLANLIKDIEDADLKKTCFNYFCQRDNANLVDYNYQNKVIEDSVLEEILDMCYHNGKSVLYTAIASINSWILFSFPIEKEWENSVIALDKENKYKLPNFYGRNRYDVVERILQDKETNEAYLVRFTHRIDNYFIEFSQVFKDDFMNLQTSELKHMVKRLNVAYSENLISLNKEDEKLYRHCKCTGVSNMFELKSAHDLGIRFYLEKKDEHHLIFGGVGRKSKYKGKKQNKDMIRAHQEIVKYEKSKEEK